MYDDYAELPAPPTIPSITRPRPISAFRRRAKTPVHSIGQLEKESQNRTKADLYNRTSAESLAGEYRALLGSPDLTRTNTIYAHHNLSPPTLQCCPVMPSEHDVAHPLLLGSCQQRSQLSPSPISDDGTLVSVDDDVIYFKPFSSTPTSSPPSEPEDLAKNEQDPGVAPDALRFQIGLELLRGELSTALTDQSTRTGRDAAALQIWVMIEAYERLRNQLINSNPETKDTKNAAAMFDSWLKTLYSIQQSMAYDSAISESEYEDED